MTTVARTLLDLATILPARAVERPIEEAERLRPFDLGALKDLLERKRGLAGTAALARAGSWRGSSPARRSRATTWRGTFSPRAAFEDDRRRDVHLTVAGYRVVRFTHRQVVREPRAVAAALGALLCGRLSHEASA